MLRARVQTRTGSTGVVLSVPHTLGARPDAWWFVHRSNRGVGRTYIPIANTVSTTHISVCNSLQTNVTLDIFTLAYQGRLY